MVRPLVTEPAEAVPCEDATNPTFAECAEDENEPNDVLDDAFDLMGSWFAQVGVACASDPDLWWVDDSFPLEWDEVRVTVEWDSCRTELDVRALSANGGDLVGIPGMSTDSERRRSLRFPAGTVAYVQVSNLDATQGPVRYEVSYDLFQDAE